MAGRFELTADRRGDPLGRFVYDRSYLVRSDAVGIDPVELKLAARVYETQALKGVFGALRNSGPDYWGRTVIERHAGKAPLGELDYLLESPDDRAGALGFGRGQKPPAPDATSIRRSILRSCKPSRMRWSGTRSCPRTPRTPRCKSCCFWERRWAAPAQKLWSRMAPPCGWQNSKGRTTDGTTRALSTRCWFLPVHADLAPPTAKSSPSATATFFW